jgi:hypothetical protein
MRVFNSDDGQLVLEDLRQRCYIYAPTLHDNPQVTAAHEGMRSVVLMIETRLKPMEPQPDKEE